MLLDEENMASIQQSQQRFKRVMSQKAFQFGADSGITGEFIVRQAATQLFQDISDINSLVTTMQYTMSPQILSGSVKPL
jgi:hypothetical protein